MKDIVTRIRIEAQVTGNDQLASIADELESIATEAGDGAPKLEALAGAMREMGKADAAISAFSKIRDEVQQTESQLDEARGAVQAFATQLSAAAAATDTAAAAQSASAQKLAQARASHDALKEAVRQAREELKTLGAESATSGEAAAVLAERMADVKGALGVLKSESTAAGASVRELGEEHRAAQAATKGAEQEQRRLTDEHQRAVLHAERLARELEQQREVLDASRGALRDAGVSVEGLSDTQVELTAKLQEAQRQAAMYVDVLGQMRAESASLSPALAATFKNLGIRSVQEITAEIERLQATMRELRTQKMLPEDAARASAELARRIEALRGELKGTAPEAQHAGQQINALGNSADGAGSKLGAAAHKAALWTAALLGLNSITDVARKVVDTGSAFEQLERRLGGILGSTDAAAQAFDQIKTLAAETPFAVEDLADSFTKLSAFGLQPTREQMLALADTAATLGGGTEALAGVTLALGQAWTKGKLQGEEMLQLAERGVPVWDMLSEATGRSVQELQKMATAGQLGRDAVLQLIDAMGQKNAGASAELMETFAGAVSNAQDVLAEFYDMIASSGVLDYLTGQIQTLLAEFDRMKDSGELQQAAQDIADGFIATAEAVRGVIAVLDAFSPAVEAAFRLWSAKKVLEVVGAWKTVPVAVAAAATATDAASARMVAATGRVATSATLAGRALGAMGNAARLIGWAAVADQVVGLATAYGQLQEALRGQRAAEISAEESAARLAERYREISERTGVSISSVEEFNAAVKTGALVYSEAEGRWVAAADALNVVSVSAEDAARALLEADARRLATEFDQLTASGNETAAALKKVAESLDLGSTGSIAAFGLALTDLQATGKASADEVGAAWQGALAKLDGAQLEAFAITAQAAFGQSERDVTALAGVMDGVLRTSIAATGQDFELLESGISTKAQSAIGHLALLGEGYDSLKQRGVDAGAALEGALDFAIQSADSTKALELLEQSLERLGREGKLSAEQVIVGLDKIHDKTDQITPGIQGMEEALKNLGLQSDVALKAVAASFKESYEAVVQMEGSVREQGEAFQKYAEAAIRANGGVADATLKAQAAQHRLRIEADAAGKAIIKAMDAAAGATGGLGDALEAAFQGLGITSEAELKRLAENAKAHFTTIKNSGQATTNDINAAFRVYAEAAIRANGGVADATLKAQAAQHGLRIEADAAGKAIVAAMNAGVAGTEALGDAAKDAATQFALLGQTIENLPPPPGTPPAPPPGTPPAPGGDGGGRPKSYNKISFFGVEQMLARAESLGGLKLRKEIEAEIDARSKVSAGTYSGFDRYAEIVRDLEKRLDAMQIAQEEASGKYESNKPQVTGTSQRNATTVYRVEIGTGAGHKTAINTADQSSADALVDLLRQLEADMARS